MSRIPCLAITALILSVSAFYGGNDDWELVTIIPKQEAAKDSTLVAFLDSLETAVLDRDTVFVFRHLHKNIVVDFGLGGRGPEGFVEYWHPFEDNSDLWDNMLRSLHSGGGWSIYFWTRRDDESFEMPFLISPRDYLCPRMKEDGTVDSMEFSLEEGGAYVADTFRVLIRGSEIPVNGPEKPWGEPPSLEVLTKYGIAEDEPMIRTFLPDLRRGYVLCRDITTPANGCQLFFHKGDSVWRIICCMGKYLDLDRRR